MVLTNPFSSHSNKDATVLLSIVTAVRNQLAYNKVFADMLNNYTYYPFELIVVDNGSSDGSGDFFEQIGATVLAQSCNRNYSDAMNIGTQKASGNYICHINNDVIVGLNWDKILIDAMECNNLDFSSPSSMELMPSYTQSRKAIKMWNRIGKPNESATEKEIIASWNMMYVDWENYCLRHKKKYEGQLLDGINGHTVMMKKSAWVAIGGYDGKMLATDWDLYLRTKKQELMEGNIVAPKIVLSSYAHHFMGTTSRVTNCNYENIEQCHKNITDKWTIDEIMKYWPFPMHLHPVPSLKLSPYKYIKYAFKRLFNLYNWGDTW